jgi:site-specific DNA-cytosine methylase
MTDRVYTVLCPFGGIGAGALGFVRAQTHLFGKTARFRLIGGIDIDAGCCADFTYLTGSPELQADIATLTVAQLRAFAGPTAPDVVFTSSPCVGASGLLSEAKANTTKYRKLNRLSLDWMKVMLESWAVPPRLLIFENVPRITTRARRMLGIVKAMLRRSGYLFHEATHDAGEIGGLAQHRRRYLLVARHAASVPSLLYQPVKKRVRACGEVLGALPMPNDPQAGPMHELPRIGWLNWGRLALIPAGGDWRDLPGVLEAGQARREKFKRHAVEEWSEPVGTVGGPGSNGVENVADPRVAGPRDGAHWHNGAHGVQDWDEPSRSVIGGRFNGAANVADQRVQCAPRAGAYGVLPWGEPAKSVVGAAGIDNSPSAVADPRPFGNVNRVTPWTEPTGTITHSPAPSSGAIAVAAAPRAAYGFKGALGVRGWDEPAGAVVGENVPANGAFSVADPRIVPQAGNQNMHDGKYQVRSFEDPVGTVTGRRV